MSSTDSEHRLRELHKAAMEEHAFEGLVMRIVAFRAYALALRDTGHLDELRHIKALDAALIEHFIALNGDPAGLEVLLRSLCE